MPDSKTIKVTKPSLPLWFEEHPLVVALPVDPFVLELVRVINLTQKDPFEKFILDFETAENARKYYKQAQQKLEDLKKQYGILSIEYKNGIKLQNLYDQHHRQYYLFFSQED